MSTREVTLDGGSPWGFRMHGGADAQQLLRIARVNPGSKAAQRGIREGDLISSINGQSTRGISNSEAHALLKNAGDTLVLGLNQETTGSPKRRAQKLIQESKEDILKRTSITSTSSIVNNTSTINRTITNLQQSNESTHTNGVGEHKDSDDSTNNFQSYIKNGTPYTTPRGASNDGQSRDTSNDDIARNHSSIHSNESVAGDDSVITALRDNTLLAATIMADNVCGSSRSRNKRRSRSYRKRAKKCNLVSNEESQDTTNFIFDEHVQSNNNQTNEQVNSSSVEKFSEDNNNCETIGIVSSDSNNMVKNELNTEINEKLSSVDDSVSTKSKKLDSVMVMVSPDSDICIVEFPKTKPKVNSSITICEISDDEHNTQENNYNVNIASDNETICDKISDKETIKSQPTQQIIESKNLKTNVFVAEESVTRVLNVNKLCNEIDSYKVEYPKPVLERKNSNSGMVKSRSLDDDEQLKITELTTDDEKSSACVSESQAIVSEASEAESDVEWETTAELAMKKETSGQQFGKMTVISLPLEEHVTYETSHISPEDERSLRDFLEGLDLVNSPEESVKRIEKTSTSSSSSSSDTTENVKMKRAKKRAALAQHFMPYFQNPRYLDVISEEGSDLSDRDNKQSKCYKSKIIETDDDDDDDVFEDIQTKYRNKFQSCYAGTNEGAILVGTKLIDHGNATMKEASWSTSMTDAPSGAEVVYLEDSSNSMTPSDLLDETTGDLDADDEEDISIDWDKTYSDSLDIEHSASETSLIKNDNSVIVSPDTASRVPQSKDEQIESNILRQPTPPPTPNTSANDTTEELKASNKTSIDFPQTALPNNINNDTIISLNDDDSTNSPEDVKSKLKISDEKEFMAEIKENSIEKQSIKESEEEVSKEIKNLCECLKKPNDEYSSQIDNTSNVVSRSDSTTSSRSTSQCTAFYNPLHSSLTNIAAMLREGSFDDKVERLAPAPLREICVRALLSMPFGKDIIEELANVSQSLEEMTCRTPSHIRSDDDSTIHNKSTPSPPSPPHPIPPPVPPRTSSKPDIDASSILLVDTPVVRSPPQKMERWVGMPTEENPNLLVCLSPSQKEFIDKTRTFPNEADSLLDLHRKYIERRGYHEHEHEHTAPTSPKKDGHTVPAFKIKIEHQNNNNENNLLKIIHNAAGADTINNNDMYSAYNTNLNYNNYVKQFTREIPIQELKSSNSHQESDMKHGNIRYDKYIKQLTREVPIEVEKQINKPVNNKIYSAALSNENTSTSNRLKARHLGEWLNLARNECDRINNSTEHIRELHNLHSSVNKLVSQHSCEERSSNPSDATFKRGTSPRRFSLPFNLYEQQMQYILEKEREVEREIEKLKEEKSSLENYEKMNANHISIPVQHEFTKRDSATNGNTYKKNETEDKSKSKFHSTELFKELHVTPTRQNVTHEKTKEHIIPIQKETTQNSNSKTKSEKNNKYHFDFTIPEFQSFMEEKSKFESNENFKMSFHKEERNEQSNYFEKVEKSEEHQIPIRKEPYTNLNKNNNKYENTELFKELHIGPQRKQQEHIIPIHKEFDAGKYQISRKGDIAILNPEEKLSPKLTQPTTVSEKFRQEMYNEYMCKIAERQERKQNKIIKIQISPKLKDEDKVSAAMSPQYEVKHVSGIEDEFMNKVREKKGGKLGEEDSENDDGEIGVATVLPPVKIIDGSSMTTDAKQLPKHLQEFIDYTTTPNNDDVARRICRALRRNTRNSGLIGDSLLHEIDSALVLAQGFLLSRGVWSPGQSTESTPSVISYEKTERKVSPPKDLKCGEAVPPVWTPRSAGSSPTAERKEFRPVNFESPTLSRKNKSKESTPAATPESVVPIPPPWEGAPKLASTQEATTTLSSSLERKLTTSQSAPVAGLNNLGKLPRAQNPTITLLQKAREGQLPRGASYIEDPQQNSQKPRSKDGRPPLIGPGEIIYTVKNEYTSESDSEKPKKMADLGPRKFEGIGPTTKDGMPIVLRSIYDHPEEVKESNQAKWYKRMYDTLHRAKNDDEYVTVRYKTRRGRYPYTSAAGYLSEPEPNAYDSDVGISASKYATLDRRRLQTRDKENEYITYTVPRNKYVPAASVKHSTDIYKNQPGRIENYVPGHSSISEKEAKEWWDEVMEIFDGWLDDHSALPSLNYMLSQVSTARSHLEQQKHVPPSKSFMSHALKESGYESDSTLVFRRREDAALQLSPHEQKEAYKTIQKGGDVPLHGLRKLAPERPKDNSEMEYFPISPTLTRIRIHKNIKPVNEILCYPVTVHHQPSTQVFSAYKRTAPSSSVPPSTSTSNQVQPPKIPSRPPSPPKRRSSRNSHTLRLISTMTIHHSPSPKSSRRHETCFKSAADKSNVKFLRDKISCKLKSPTAARKNVKVTKTISTYPSTSRESIMTTLSSSKDAKGTSNTIKSKTDISTCKHKDLDQHYSRSTASSSARRCCRHCSFSVPPKITEVLKTVDKSKPRAVSLERTFGTEKRKVDLTLPKLSLDQRLKLVKSPDLVSPTEVKKTLQKQKVLLDQKYPPGTTIKKTTSIFSSAKNGLKNVTKPEEKSLNVTVAYSARGRELLSSSPKTTLKSVKTSSPVTGRANRNLISPVPSNISDKSKSSSKSRALSTESLSSPTARKRTPVPVKPATISRIKSTNTLSKENLLLNNDKKKNKKVKKDQSNEELKKEKKSQKLKESKLKINDKPKTKKCAGRAAGTEIVKKLKKMEHEHVDAPRISAQLIKDQQQDILQSDSFFQHLFLRDMLSSPTPSIASKSSFILEKTKMLENLHTSLPYSEPTINALKVYLSHRKPVSESKFKTLDRELVRSRSASPCILSRSFSESRNKFDSISEVSNEDTYYDSRYSSQDSIRNKRSSSLPATKIIFTETSRPVSPCVEKSIVRYRENRSPSTSPIRSPSRRKIHSIKLPASITVEGISGLKRKAVRARSAGEAEALKREMYLSEKMISPATSTVSLTQIVDPQEYKNYVTELRHSARKSDRFKELNRFYTSLERLSQLERTTSSTDLRPRRKNEEEIIDYDRWMQVRTRERAEQEFNTLYKKLKQDQKERDLLFRPKDVNQFRWKYEREFGLKIKEQSVENIKEQFEKLKVLESPMEASRRRILNYEKDVYKPLWRGNSVLNLVSKISGQRSQSESRVSAVKQRILNEEQLLTREIGSKLWSSLSVEQVNALKHQLAEIYSQGPGPLPKKEKEDYSITVEPQSKINRSNNLLIRRNSANEFTLAKSMKRNECVKSASIGAISGHALSENEKKKISQSLSREVKDRMSQRKKYTSTLSIVLGKETRGAIAAAEAKVKPSPEISSPRTCYSLEPTEEDINNKQSKTEKDFLLVLTKDESEDQKENVRQTLDNWAQSKNDKTDTILMPAKPVSSTSETESASSDNSAKTAIFVDKKEDLHKKIEYFEKGIEETYVPTIHRPAEDDVVDADVADIVPLDNNSNCIDVQKERRPSTLMTSQSYADLKELFGEKDLLKFATIPLSATRKSTISTPKRPLLRATSPIKTLSEASSRDSLIRSRSISPDTERFWNAYLSLINGVDVRKLTEKFELLKDFYSNRTVTRTHRRCKSDPELISARKMNEREFGDVYWLKKRYENLDRSRSRIRRHGKTSPIAKTPLKAEDRLMPHINIISKLASLYPKKQLTPEEKNKSVENLAKSLGCPIGEVEKLREKFDSPERNDVSLLGHMFTSSPNIQELRDIAPYLAGPWIAHQYPRFQDNSRSASSPDRNGSSRTLIRRDRPRPKSTSPPRISKPPSSILKSHVQHQKDIFANQFYDPRIHRPICRYQPSSPKADRSRSWSPVPKHTVTFKEPVMGPTPPPKGQPYNRDSGSESPRKYVEDEVTIHYRSPVRHEIKEAISEEELARRQAEAMRRIYQEERRRKYLQELQDMNSRRHTDNFIPSQKSPISLNRYDDFIDDLSPKIKLRDRSPEPRLVARALYNFVGQSARELSFRKGDVIFIRRQVDKNWYEGEHNAMIGLFPSNYVEIIPYDGIKTTPRKANEGQARAKFNFIAQTHLELSLAKGELVVLTRRVDDNWFEGRIGNRKGIFPVSYVEILIDPSEKGEIILTSSKPVASPASHSLLLNGSSGGKESMGSHHYQPNYSSQTTTTSYHAKPVNVIGTTTSYQSITRSQKITTGPAVNEALHIDTHHSEPVPYRALYKYRPQNDDELELQEGDTVFVLEKCDDGWYVGSSQRTGAFGTFPGNYVERI